MDQFSLYESFYGRETARFASKYANSINGFFIDPILIWTIFWLNFYVI